jgi:hypothetical protein
VEAFVHAIRAYLQSGTARQLRAPDSGRPPHPMPILPVRSRWQACLFDEGTSCDWHVLACFPVSRGPAAATVRLPRPLRRRSTPNGRPGRRRPQAVRPWRRAHARSPLARGCDCGRRRRGLGRRSSRLLPCDCIMWFRLSLTPEIALTSRDPSRAPRRHRNLFRPTSEICGWAEGSIARTPSASVTR